MDLQPKIKEDIEEEEIIDVAFVKVEQNYSDLSRNFYDENDHLRDKIGENIEEEGPGDFAAVIKTENVVNTTKLEIEIMESEGDICIADVGANPLESEKLEIKEILDPDIKTMSSAEAETSVLNKKMNKHQRLQRNPKNDADIYKDNECEYQPRKKAGPRKYKTTRTLVKNHVCVACCKSFGQKIQLGEHILRHHDDDEHIHLVLSISSKVHTCRCCEYKTTLKAQLAEHILRHHKNADAHLSSISSKIHKCSYCEYKTTLKKNLAEHILRHHNNDVSHLNLVSSISTKIHKCSYCDYKTTNKIILSGHLLRHTKNNVSVHK